MDIDNIIRQRRSTFTGQFTGQKISSSLVRRMLENANWAPNHYHTEPWRFVVYSDRGCDKLMDALADIYKKYVPEEKFSQAKFDKFSVRKRQISHAIVISVKNSHRPDLPEVEEICATACAVQNMWLTLTAFQEVGGYWSTGNLVYTPEFSEFAQLSEDETCLGIFYLGMKKKDAIIPEGKRTNWADKVTYVNE
jgi:nitroreductase